MKKKVLFLSILCLLFVTLSYSGYSEYSRTSETITITSNYIKITFTSDS